MTVRMHKTPSAEDTREAIREQARAEREMRLKRGESNVPTQEGLEKELVRLADRQDNQRR